MVKSLSVAPSWLWYDSVDPGLSETNVSQFNWWLNTNTADIFICLDATLGAQAWEKILVQGNNFNFNNLIASDGGALQTNTGVGDNLLIQAYDTDAFSYVTFGTLTANNVPTFTLSPTSITFSGESALNHYLEQQTWVPVITGTGSAGTGTYSVQSGYYTRIGNMIFSSLTITWSAHTGTGDMTITGFPFPARNSSNYTPEATVLLSNILLPIGTIGVGASISANTSIVSLYGVINSAALSPIQMSATGSISLSLAYIA